MADDLISREAVMDILHECGGDEMYPPNMVEMRGRMQRLSTVDAVMLPCKIGDTVYVIWGVEIVEATVCCHRPFIYKDRTEFRGNAICIIEDPFFNDGRTMKHELFIVFGFDAFLTHEEAEAALKERREENG